MPKTFVRLAALFFALAGLGLAQPALAGVGADISTPAWTNHELPLHFYPSEYSEVKTVLPGGLRISVDECTNMWCRIHAGRLHGYAFLYALSFGHGPNSILWPPRLRHPRANYSWSW